MNGFMTIFKRELKGYFATPVAYVFLVIFLFFAGYLPFEKEDFFNVGQADMQAFFKWLPILFIFMVPGISMRLWAEEKKSGTIELLFTLPIDTMAAVLGKFAAAWCFMALGLVLTCVFPVTLLDLGKPDMGQIICGYIGSFLLCGGYLAIGGFCSAITRSQVISFILAVVGCAVFYSIALPTSQGFLSSILGNNFAEIFASLSFERHFDSIKRGVIRMSDLSYFFIMIASWLCCTSIIIKERKAA
ncbi:MAG: ABC transporter permease subunit [Phycisphaerae bacterium]|nr:ABC transporter permease subunit [Phycisphaerae bacterium]